VSAPAERRSAIDAALPVTTVTLLEDRAVVTRSGKVAAPAGALRLEVRGVAPILADKTLTARVEGAELTDVRVRREPIHRVDERPDEARAIAEEIASLDAELARREAARQAAVDEAQHVSAARELALREIAEDAAWGRVDAEASARAFDDLAARGLDLALQGVDAVRAVDELRQRLADKHARALTLAMPSTRARGTIEVDVESAAPAEIVLTLSYVVPAACWRPHHTAHDLGGGRVRFACEATLWQNTGEDWTGSELVFSTARPSLGANPPELESDVLAATRRSQAIVVEAREQTREEAGRGSAPAKGLPGVDDGGEARRLVAQGAHTIPSDGRPHRVPLFSFESDGARELVATPELADAVFERTELTNGAAQPILAGPVDLVRAGGPAGKATVLYVAPNERFLLGWGAVSALRVRRDVEPLVDESSFLGGWTTTTEDVIVKLSNLGAEARRVVVRERVPVSEIEKLEVTVVAAHTTGKQQPDRDGFVTWTVELAPHGREKIRLRKSIRRHADVIG
jgi:uncharacterized protein (TIGR02231 family)